MSAQERFEHRVTSPQLRLGAAILVLLILAAGISPLIQSIFS
ncbi:MAG: hypothetical protein ACYCW5_03635 [Thermoleophilia bacterium]